MAVNLKPIDQQVIVITGASSGIGLATAKAAARRGARLVLAARNGEALAEIERDLRDSSAAAETESGTTDRVVHIAADVGKRQEVERIANLAIQRFGGFDTWVNNAGVSIWGRLEDVPEEDARQLFETNFWGVVHGSLIAARYFREHRSEGADRHGGSIINVGSVASDVALPLQVMYAASKHAVKGFTDGLRMELEEAGEPVSVTLIKPAAIDTPLTQHARKHTEREVKLPPPVYRPEEVANAILHAAAHPVRDIYVGGASRLMSGVNRLAPGIMDWIGETMLVEQQLRPMAPRNRRGSLYEAGRDAGRIRGDHPGYVMRTSAYTRAALHPAMTAALIAAATVAVAAAMRGGARPRRPYR